MPNCFRRAAVVFLLMSAGSVQAAEFFIAPTGNDSNRGTLDQPWATLEKARDTIRARRKTGELKNEKVVVWLRGGDYELSAPFTLTEEDSGTPEFPIEFSAYGDEIPRVIGGRRISTWTKVAPEAAARLFGSAREHVLAADLRAHGIAEFPALSARSRDLPLAPGPLAVSVQSRPTVVARWPNQGWASARRVGDAHFQAEGAPQIKSSEQMMVHAFWSADDCDRWDRAKIVRERIQLDFAGEKPRMREGARYCLHGCPEFLDAPGEWYLKPDDGLLFFWPPSGCDLAKDIFVSLVETPISLYGVSHFTLNGLHVEGARVMGVEVAGGVGVKLRRCKVSNVGNVGIHLYHGREHEVTDCEIAYCGSEAVRVAGGDRDTLQPYRTAICNNHIHDFGRLDYSFHPGIHVSGVGVRVNHNEIHNGPHGGVHLAGNDHLVEFNDIHHVCTETEDCGAIYLGSDPTYRGNIIQHNLIRHLGGFSHVHVVGVYLDDFASGTTVLGNAFQQAGRGVAVGGGRDNVIENNLFVDCVAAIQIDSRGQTWARTWLENKNSRLHKSFTLFDVDADEVRNRYGNLRDFLTDSPGLAKNNRVVRNAVFGGSGVELHDGLTAVDVHLDANFHDTKQRVALDQHEDPRQFHRLPDLANGFDQLPLERMGRTKLSTVTNPLVLLPVPATDGRDHDSLTSRRRED